MDLPVMPPVDPMLARAVPSIPVGHRYEPKWDGFRAIVFRDRGEVEIGSRSTKPIQRYFPEVVEAALAHVPERCVVDGEIVVPSATTDGLDFEALQARIHSAESRVRLLSRETPALLVVFDVLALGDDDLTGLPFAQRRAALESVIWPAGPVYVTPSTDDRALAGEWFSQFEGAGLDGVVAKHPDERYQPGKRVMAKIKHERTADCVVAGYRPHASGPDAVGSLLLGLWTDDGTLAAVGVASSCTYAQLEAPVGYALADVLAAR